MKNAAWRYVGNVRGGFMAMLFLLVLTCAVPSAFGQHPGGGPPGGGQPGGGGGFGGQPPFGGQPGGPGNIGNINNGPPPGSPNGSSPTTSTLPGRAPTRAAGTLVG